MHSYCGARNKNLTRITTIVQTIIAQKCHISNDNHALHLDFYALYFYALGTS